MPEDISPVMDDNMKGFNLSDSRLISLIIFCSLLKYFINFCNPTSGNIFIF